MKWHNSKYVKPKKEKVYNTDGPMINDTRIVCKYLWRPRSFKSDITRWLEYAYICQRFDGTIVDGESVGKWVDFCFSNEEEYDNYLSILARKRREKEEEEELYYLFVI